MSATPFRVELAGENGRRREWISGFSISEVAAVTGFGVAPVSIAVSEILLGLALAFCLLEVVRERWIPRVAGLFWCWIVWAALEMTIWWRAGHTTEGAGEIRHLGLLAAVFLIVARLGRREIALATWKAVLVGSTIGSASVIVSFCARAWEYRGAIAAGGDPAFYLRTGGLLHHWMIYATVEALVFGGLLEYRAHCGAAWQAADCQSARRMPSCRTGLQSALWIHGIAIVLSLTRMLWVSCAVIYFMHAGWKRRLLVVPAAAVCLLAFAPIRERVLDPTYYSNAERVQMWGVGLRMIGEHPWIGVGPGQVERLYTQYAPKGELIPAYHGHLHDNALQLAAQFGMPVLAAAMVCFWELYRTLREPGRDRFLARSGLFGLTGFLICGLTDYTYGHALGLLLLGFVVLCPLTAGYLPVQQGERLPRNADTPS